MNARSGTTELVGVQTSEEQGRVKEDGRWEIGRRSPPFSCAELLIHYYVLCCIMKLHF